jgi:hypothetical protein
MLLLVHYIGYDASSEDRADMSSEEHLEFVIALTIELLTSQVKDDDLLVRVVGTCLTLVAKVTHTVSMEDDPSDPWLAAPWSRKLALVQFLTALFEKDEVLDALGKKPKTAADILTVNQVQSCWKRIRHGQRIR